MPDKTPRIAAAYIRVSTDEQAEQSPESQLIEIRKYADRNGIILPDEYIFMDEGISGKRTENRPAFMQMIGTAKERPAPFDTILLWKFSRFARNQEESIVYKALLRKQCGVDVVSVSEPLPGGMFSSLIERIIEWFDEFYSIRLSQEVKRTMTVKAGRGEFQSSPSFGYRADTSADKTILVPIPEEAAIVQEIYNRFNAGDGCYKIARWINSQGITTHRGNPFENRTVEYILRNPVYIGKLRWTPTGRTRRNFNNADTIVADAAHEPIITQEVWDSAQHRLDEIKAMWGYKARPTYELKDWLGGVVRCSECGCTLIFAKPHYFKCNNYVRGRCRSSQHIHVNKLHEAIIGKLQKDARPSSPINFTLERRSNKEGGEIERLNLHLADLNRRKERLMDAYLSAAMDLETYQKMNLQLTEGIEEAKSRLADLQKPDSGLSYETAKAKIQEALKTIESPDASIEDKNTAIRSIAEKIVFCKDQGTLDIVYRIFI